MGIPTQKEVCGQSTNTAAEVPKWAMKLVGLKATNDKCGQQNTN